MPGRLEITFTKQVTRIFKLVLMPPKRELADDEHLADEADIESLALARGFLKAPKDATCSTCQDNGMNGRCPECGRFTTTETIYDINRALLRDIKSLREEVETARAAGSERAGRVVIDELQRQASMIEDDSHFSITEEERMWSRQQVVAHAIRYAAKQAAAVLGLKV